MPSQSFVDEGIVRVQQVKNAAVFAEAAREKQFSFLFETLQQRLVVIRIADRINDNLIAAVDQYVGRDEVILGLPKTVYRLDAQAPVYIVAAAGGHGGDTVVNHHSERRLDAKTFFDSKDPAELQAILDRWDPQWVLVRKDLPYPREFMQQYTPVYEDKLFALYPVDPATIARIDALQGASAAN